MRTGKVLVLGLLLITATGGCARGGGGDDTGVASANGGAPSASASVSAGGADAPIKFSQCMREHGMTWFPDPQPNGGVAVNVPADVSKEKMEAAQEACKEFAPGGGDAQGLSAADLEKARLMAKCMRDNGVANFPDPKPDGSIELDLDKVGMGPGNAVFDKAQQLCDKYAPTGRTSEHKDKS
jgi:hypothetical protein